MSLFLMLLLLQFAAAAGQTVITTKTGGEVSLPCGNVIKNQEKCGATTWLDGQQTPLELVSEGQINVDPHRLSLAADCSLVIKNITKEDAGKYTCRQFVSGKQNGSDVPLVLSVIITAAGQTIITTKTGGEVSLPCGNVIKNQEKCGATTWIFSSSKKPTARELVNLGQIKEDPDRLSLAADCSLVIKNVTKEDFGRYTCRQFVSGQKQGPDERLFLSVVTMHEDKINTSVFLFCTVSTYRDCQHTVEWLYAGDQTDVEIRPAACSSRVEIPHPDQSSQIKKLLQCKVTEKGGRELLFTIDHCSTYVETEEEEKNNNQSPPPSPVLWPVLIVLCVAVLLITIIAVIRWRKAKGNRIQEEENDADPEGNVFYASIDHSMNSSERQVTVKHDDDGDEGGAVTYCTVKASPAAAAGASADPNSLYASVNKGRDKV